MFKSCFFSFLSRNVKRKAKEEREEKRNVCAHERKLTLDKADGLVSRQLVNKMSTQTHTHASRIS